MERAAERAILVVSFGTTHEDTLKKNIVALESEISAQYPEYRVDRAFTSGMVRKILSGRGIEVPDVEAALEKMYESGVRSVIVQPTHLLCGFEYEKIVRSVRGVREKFSEIVMAKPLLSSTEDLISVLKVVSEENPVSADTAIVLMGHGTAHDANVVYPALNYIAGASGMPHVFVGTVEGYPEVDQIIESVQKEGFKNVLLTPLMFVAGDHAKNDMASDEADSWKSRFEAAGFSVACLIKGLGEYTAVRTLYLEHIKAIAR